MKLFVWKYIAFSLLMDSQAEKLYERYGNYTAAEQAFFCSAEEPLWSTSNGEPFSSAPQASCDTQKQKHWNQSACSSCGDGKAASHAEAEAGPPGCTLESALGKLLTGIDVLEDATDVFRLHDYLHSLNLAMERRARTVCSQAEDGLLSLNRQNIFTVD